MKLGTVISSSNLIETYSDFIPIFIKTWKKLFPEVKVIIVLISDHIPEKLEKYSENIVLFNVPDISSAFQSQYIRLLYPALIENSDGVLITDIDMIPMNRDYYVNSIKNIESDKFISYRNVLLHLKEIPMCYNIATPNVWKSIFNISGEQDIKNRLIEEYSQINYDGLHGGKGWTTDQTRLYKIIMDWNTKTGKYKILNDKITGYNRLDRIAFNSLNEYLKNNIQKGVYTDYHMHRPFSFHENMINGIVECLPKDMA